MFKIQTDGTGFAIVKCFTNSVEGANPYGWPGSCPAARSMGRRIWRQFGCGTVFKVNTDGTGYTVLKNFTGSDGGVPSCGPVLSGSTLYGTTGRWRQFG